MYFQRVLFECIEIKRFWEFNYNLWLIIKQRKNICWFTLTFFLLVHKQILDIYFFLFRCQSVSGSPTPSWPGSWPHDDGTTQSPWWRHRPGLPVQHGYLLLGHLRRWAPKAARLPVYQTPSSYPQEAGPSISEAAASLGQLWQWWCVLLQYRRVSLCQWAFGGKGSVQQSSVVCFMPSSLPQEVAQQSVFLLRRTELFKFFAPVFQKLSTTSWGGILRCTTLQAQVSPAGSSVPGCGGKRTGQPSSSCVCPWREGLRTVQEERRDSWVLHHPCAEGQPGQDHLSDSPQVRVSDLWCHRWQRPHASPLPCEQGIGNRKAQLLRD